MHSIQKAAALVFLVAVGSVPTARCEETIPRLPDGRYLVQLKNVTIALPEENPKSRMTTFFVSTPPGTRPFYFTLTDLVRDFDQYAPRLRSSDWSSFSASSSRPREILGQQVVRGVTGIGIHAGVDKNCEAWLPEWTRYRQVAIGLPADQYGWTRQDNLRSPPTSTFIKFLDQGDRTKSRYYPLHCDFSGECSLRACRDGLTAWVRIHSSNKIQGKDYSVKDFDRQIASGIKLLEHIIVNRSVDLSHP
jgi:hypothetical protein